MKNFLTTKLTSKKIFIILVILPMLMLSCTQAGITGYYELYPYPNKRTYIKESFINNTLIKITNTKDIRIGLPQNCSQFLLAGFITPVTPPIPFGYFRSWHWQQNDPCNYFGVYAPKDLNIFLLNNGEAYNYKRYDEKNSFYFFPIKAREINSGSIIIEEGGQKTEVPFEYKYFKFWY